MRGLGLGLGLSRPRSTPPSSGGGGDDELPIVQEGQALVMDNGSYVVDSDGAFVLTEE